MGIIAGAGNMPWSDGAQAQAASLQQYRGGGVLVGVREVSEVRSHLLMGGFFDFGLSESCLLRTTVDRVEQDWTLAIAPVFVFDETTPLVRPYLAAGVAKTGWHGAARPDGRLGLALGGWGLSTMLLELRWMQVATDFTLGWTTPL